MNRLIFFLLLFVGCTPPATQWDAGVEDHTRASALLAKYNALETSPSPVTPNGPTVGSNCPECNDPPGGCGPGKVGDSVVCVPCGVCGGDGKIDENDVRSTEENEAIIKMQNSFLSLQMEAVKSTKCENKDCSCENCETDCACVPEKAPETPAKDVEAKKSPTTPATKKVSQTEAQKPKEVEATIVKPRLVMYTLDGCPPCERTKRETLPIIRKRGADVDVFMATSGVAPRFEIYVGGKLVARHSGFLSVEQFENYIGHTSTAKKKIVSTKVDWRNHPWSQRRWSFPGSIESHLRSHRVPDHIINSLSRQDRILLHNYLHNKERSTGSMYYEGEEG